VASFPPVLFAMTLIVHPEYLPRFGPGALYGAAPDSAPAPESVFESHVVQNGTMTPAFPGAVVQVI
jgi:hypothetical protein